MNRSDCINKLQGIFWSDTFKDCQNAGKVLDEYVASQVQSSLARTEKALDVAVKALEESNDIATHHIYCLITDRQDCDCHKGMILEALAEIKSLRSADKKQGGGE